MTGKQILERLSSGSEQSIFGFMYGKPYVNTNRGVERDRVIEISVDSLDIIEEESCLFYVWGFPGPDYNVYYFSDYGKTWAFSKDELLTSNDLKDG